MRCLFRKEDHSIRLNKEFHLDLIWWLHFFHSWDGSSFFLSPQWVPLLDFQVLLDKAGNLGGGAIFVPAWFAGAWSSKQVPMLMAYKGLFPAVVAASLWGSQCSSSCVEFSSDNSAVVRVFTLA